MKPSALCRCAVVAALFVFASKAAYAAEPTEAAPAPAHDAPTVGDSAQAPAHDYLMPRAGEFSATFASGVPFLGIGEVAYGPTDRFAIGALAGATPDMSKISGTAAIGLRPRGVIWKSGAWRSTLTTPVLFYPKLDGFGGREPWLLARPTIALEREIGPGARVNVSVGAIAAACTESIFTLGKEHTMEGGVWNTAGVGGALPVTASTSVFAEGSLVMRGVVPAADWIGGTPLIAFAGVTTRL
jgi:hypothetical protein